MAEQLVLNVDTGSVDVVVRDKGEDVGTFRFNPSDLDIIRRYDSVIAVIEGLKVEENATQEDVFRITDELKVQINYLLNYNVADAIFAKCNPLTPTTSGDFFFEVVLDQIGALIEKTTSQRVAKKKARIQRAMSKYHK